GLRGWRALGQLPAGLFARRPDHGRLAAEPALAGRDLTWPPAQHGRRRAHTVVSPAGSQTAAVLEQWAAPQGADEAACRAREARAGLTRALSRRRERGR